MGMGVRAEATVKNTHEVKLSPILTKNLRKSLLAYADLKRERDEVEAKITHHKGVVEHTLDELGESSLDFEGYKMTIVSQVRKSIDQKRLLELGVTMDVIEAATVEKPTKPYPRITCPGVEDE
jgi:hypothetical protein